MLLKFAQETLIWHKSWNPLYYHFLIWNYDGEGKSCTVSLMTSISLDKNKSLQMTELRVNLSLKKIHKKQWLKRQLISKKINWVLSATLMLNWSYKKAVAVYLVTFPNMTCCGCCWLGWRCLHAFPSCFPNGSSCFSPCFFYESSGLSRGTR